MRSVFGEMLCELGEQFPELTVLDCDTSSSTQTKVFGNRFPERFYNFGIAEGNMVSAAAGMATCGLIPVASAFAFLLALRAGDPVRSLIAYNRLNVKLAGAYAGLSDFADGASHQSVTDIAVMRAMPNMTILVPSDIESTRALLRCAIEMQGPVYLRLSRNEVPSLHGGDEDFLVGKAKAIRAGTDITLAVTGTLLGEAIAAAELLAEQGIEAEIWEFHTVKPFDADALLRSAEKTGKVISIEEHSILGGLGSAVAECLSENNPNAGLRRIGIQDTFGCSGQYPELLDTYGLTAKHIIQAALSFP